MGGIEAIPFGLLVFVVGLTVISSAWSAVDARMAVDSAAAEGLRALVEADPDAGIGPVQQATAAARMAFAGSGRDPARLVVEVDAPDISRCRPVTVNVSYTLPSIRTPVMGSIGPPVVVRAGRSGLVDPLRSGLDGRATCVG